MAWVKFPIKEFELLYEVNEYGLVRRVRGAFILATKKHKNGYRRCVFRVGGKLRKFYTHRIVAMAFIPKVEGKNHINHKDGVTSNNHYLNLEWCTPAENNRHAISIGKKLGRPRKA